MCASPPLVFEANALLGRASLLRPPTASDASYAAGPGPSAAFATSERRAEVPKPPVPLAEALLNDLPALRAIAW